MVLWMLKITSDSVSAQYINDTVYIENGTESTQLSCGENPQNWFAIYWSKYKSDEWSDILKVYPNRPSKKIAYYEGHTAKKYAITGSLNTSLLVKNLDLSDTGLFRCRSAGGGVVYSYITLVKNVGESLFSSLYSKPIDVIQHNFKTTTSLFTLCIIFTKISTKF